MNKAYEAADRSMNHDSQRRIESQEISLSKTPLFSEAVVSGVDDAKELRHLASLLDEYIDKSNDVTGVLLVSEDEDQIETKTSNDGQRRESLAVEV